jgi:DNA polymerase III subunit alpha
MSSQEFVHLHIHTDFSLLNSAIQISALAKKLNELEMNACAITDYGNMFGALSFYYNMKKHGIQPILGYEAFLTLEDRRQRQAALKAGELPYYKLVLLAENLAGYYNLVALSSKAFTEGLHHKPRIDLTLLAQHSKGLIALTSGLEGLIGHRLSHERFDDAFKCASDLRDIFGKDNFFLEIQDHGLPEEKKIRNGLIDISQKLETPLVATNNAYYLTRDDAKAHEMMLCIGAGKTIYDDSRPKIKADNYYIRSKTEMWELFGKELPDALRQTVAIAERCQITLPNADDSLNLPDYPIPETSNCRNLNEYFEEVVMQGFALRSQTVWKPLAEKKQLRYELDVYEARIRKEIDIIGRMGYPGYFLIVWDFVRYAKENEIPVGPGRGSAAGSLVAYCLEITDVDPIQYDLLFERFLNPERVTMPDIDIDFCIRGREHVIRHVVEQYGRESVCQIVTFGTMASKAVVKDVGRALNMPYAEVDKIAKMIPPPVRGRNVSISQAIEQVEELRQAIESNQQIKELIDLARRLEGCVRHTSVHAAGVVISPKPLHELVPVALSVKDELTTQYAMSDLEKTGMLKMDFLALTTLTIINDCLNSIKQTTGQTIDWNKIPLDDAESMRIFGDGRTEAIFQFESPGMQEICRRLKPQGIEDLAALNALYRPGPLDGGMVDDFIARHRGRKQVRYLVPQMKEILCNTHGIIVYQEQIMQLAQQLAGYTLGEADMMRRAMGKKKREEMARHQEKFVQGAVERNIKKEKAEQIFSLMAQFADYGFNRSHSVAYAYLAFQTAYLKAHYPAHFYSSVLSHESHDAAKVHKYIAELRDAQISLLPPDINQSNAGFTPVDGSVRFGLSAIKGIGGAAIQEIIQSRRERRFASFYDFVSRLAGSINKRVLHGLICAGAFDSLLENVPSPRHWRSLLCAEIENSLAAAQKIRTLESRGQSGLFLQETEATPISLKSDTKIWSEKEFWTVEKETLGFYLSNHPLSGHESLLKAIKAHNIIELSSKEVLIENLKEQKFSIAGVVSDLQIRTSKKGSRFATFKLEDSTGAIKCLAWSDAFERSNALLKNDEVIVVSGRLETGEETSATFIIEETCLLPEALPNMASAVYISLPRTNCDDSFCEKLLNLLYRHRGKCEVFLEIPGDDSKQLKNVRLGVHGSLRIRGCLTLENELAAHDCRVVWRV